MAWPSTETVAVTGPSAMSSYQPSLLPKDTSGSLFLAPDRPAPPSTTSRPCSSVCIRPSGTSMPWNVPPVNSTLWPVPARTVLRPGSMTRLRRSMPLLRLGVLWPCMSGMSRARLNSYQAAFWFATWTPHSIEAFSFVSSRTGLPALL